MTGLPAARQTDMTLKGGPITQGSLTVFIGSQGGIACSTCPGGVKVANPVNPMLGAKVQDGEVDLALPGALPFVISRDYSSYQTDTPAPVGLLGPGWWLPSEVSLIQTDRLLTLNDSKGRSIRFEPLAPGQSAYSRSENLWIVRGGLERLDTQKVSPVTRLNMAWMGLHEDDRRNSSFFFITTNPLGPWWILGPSPAQGEFSGQRLFLLGLNDRFGKSLRIGRDAKGNMTAVQDGVGRQFRLELKTLPGIVNEGSHGWGADTGVRLMAVHLTRDPMSTDQPTQPLVRYEYSPCGELTAVHGRDGSLMRRFQYHAHLPGRMIAHAHAGRPPVSYVYNQDGKVIEQNHQGALSYRFDYSQKDATTVTDSLGRTRIYHFKGEAGVRRVVKLQHADGNITQDRFDNSGRLLCSIDALGRETRYELDISTGSLLSISQPDGLQSQFGYNAQGQIEQTMRPNGAIDRYAYDDLGRLASVIDALGLTTRYHYANDQSEQPERIVDARGGIKQLTWNLTGHLTSYTDCSGSVTSYRYDRWGHLTDTSGEEGTSAKSDYDARGRITASTNALNQTTVYAYNEAGDLTHITSPGGNSAQFERDAQGQLRVYHYGGLTQLFTYDEAGRVTVLTNENGARTTFEYDVMDRLTKQVNFDNRTQHYQFNAVGDLVQSNDEGLVSRYHYDKGGRLLQRQIGEGEQAPGEHFDYSQDGQLSRAWHVTELGGNRIEAEFERDLLGRTTRETQSIFGPDGNSVWQNKVDRQFDELGTEMQTTYSGLPAIEWQTYGSGHLHGVMLDGLNLIEFERDKLHRETKRQFGSTQTLRSYDALSRLSHLHTHSPLVGEEDSLHRQHHYDPAGQLTRIDTPKGLHEYGYDKAGRLISASQPGLVTQHYRFDPAGNRLFDNLQLATRADHWEETVRQRMYDKNFNLLGKDVTKDEHVSGPKWMDNRIMDDGEFHYQYDAWGNLRQKYKAEGNEQHRYHYDSNHRLIRYELESDTAVRGANYHYDPFGRRLVKQVQEADGQGNLQGEVQTTFFGWDGDRLVLTEKDNLQIHTIYEPGSFVPMIRLEGEKKPLQRTLARKMQEEQGIRLDRKTESMFDGLEQELRNDRLSAFSRQWMQTAQMQPETLRAMLGEEPTIRGRLVHTYQCDHLGTPLALYCKQGAIDWSVELDAWGRTLKEFNPNQLHQSVRLQGQQTDEESGLFYNRNRYYEPDSGRFITKDPIGLSGGLNHFSYVNGNPLNNIDPLGLMTLESWWESSKAGFQSGLNDPLGELEKIFQAMLPGEGAFAAASARGLGAIRQCISLKTTRVLSKSEIKAIGSQEAHIAEHLRKISEFKNNLTIRPGMENLPKEIIEAQQARRIQHLQQEIDAGRKNIQDILGGTSNSGK